MSCGQLISGLSTYVMKRRQRSDDSILLRHMDDVVGSGPEEHLMSDFEHMKTLLSVPAELITYRMITYRRDVVQFFGIN